jgi:hypothetical protein
MVLVVEVKRSAESLWQAIESSEGGKYLRKFARFREEGAQVGQTREVRVALRQEGDAALDRYSPRADDTPRNLADEERIAIEVGQ